MTIDDDTQFSMVTRIAQNLRAVWLAVQERSKLSMLTRASARLFGRRLTVYRCNLRSA